MPDNAIKSLGPAAVTGTDPAATAGDPSAFKPSRICAAVGWVVAVSAVAYIVPDAVSVVARTDAVVCVIALASGALIDGGAAKKPHS